MSMAYRDGVGLYYEEAGAGSPPMLLVHGFGGDHTDLAPQFEHFRGSRRVVNVDRRGHGLSDAPDQEYTIGGFADDLAWLCGEIGLYRPVVVVHSQDKIGFDLAARYPDLVAALVLIDTPSFPPQPIAEMFAGVAAGFRSPDYRSVLREFATNAFAPTDDAARRDAIIERMCGLPQRVIAGTWDAYLSYDLAPVLSACRAPVLHIGSWFPADIARLQELCPGLQSARCDGAGHFAMLEAPERVNALIEQFVAETLAVAA